MEQIDERRIIYFESEEHLVRRLGAALVVVWKQLTPDTRNMIVERAERVLDQGEIEHFEEKLSDLIAQQCRKTADVTDKPEPKLVECD